MIYSLVLLNKPVIDSDKNEKVGRVKGYVIDPEGKKVIAFILAPDSEKATLNIIPFTAVKSLYDNAVIIENLPAPIQMSDVPEILKVFLKDIAVIGAQVITDTGMLAGSVRDFAIGEKNGEIRQISLVPERPGVPRIDAKYIIRITQSRIMVSSKSLENVPPAPAKVLPPEPQKPAAPQPPSKEEAEEPEEYTAADGAESHSEETEAPRAARQAIHNAEIVDEEIVPLFRESFIEMTRILMGRLNAIDPSEALNRLKEELLEAVKSAPPAETEVPEPGSAAELVFEEKVRRAVSRPVEELRAEIKLLRELIAGGLKIQPPEIAVEPPDLSPIRASVESAENRLAEKISAVAELLSKPAPQPPALEPVRPAIDELASSVESLRSKIPTREEMRNQLSEFGKRFEERSDALNKIFKAELDRHAQTLRENRTEPVQKSEPPQIDFSKLEDTLRGLMEDFRDQFATRLSVELGEQKHAESAESERKFTEKLEGIEWAVTETIESRLAERGDLAARALGEVRDLFRETENRIIELREHRAAEKSELDQVRKTILDEIRSYTDTTLKPEDLLIVRQWIGELIPIFSETAAEKIRDTVGALREKIESIPEEEIAARELLRGLGEELSEITEKTREFADRLDQRDKYYEEGVQSILSAIEKLIKRGLRPDLDGLFSGGGLISSIFSGRQTEQPMKLTGQTSSKIRASKSSTVEDSQVRRFAYLLGKKLAKDIRDAEGNILAEEGDTVDEALIRRLRDKQLTLELIRAVAFKD